MKFLHTADWHIGALRTSSGIGQAASLERFSSMFGEICDIARSKTDGVVIVSGDLFHWHSVKQDEQNILLESLIDATSSGLTFVLINGNHDLLETGKSSIKYIELVARCVPRNRLIVASCINAIKLIDGLNIVMAPPIRMNDEIKYSKKLQAMIEHRYKNLPTVCIAHAAISKTATDSGTALKSGGRRSCLKRYTGIDYWALGDNHTYQKVTHNAYYSGSPIQQSWHEQNNKGVVLVDLGGPGEGFDTEFIGLSRPKSLTVVKDASEADGIDSDKTIVKFDILSGLKTCRTETETLDGEPGSRRYFFAMSAIDLINDRMQKMGLPKEKLTEFSAILSELKV